MQCNCNQKGGSRKPTAMTRVPPDPSSCDLTIHRNCTDMQPILIRTSFLPSLTDPLTTSRLTDPTMHHSTRRAALVTHCTQMFLKKNAWIIIHGLYVQSESANTALEHKFLQKQEALIVPLILLLLSLSMSSCSNELDHPSDAAEDHSHGQDFCY